MNRKYEQWDNKNIIRAYRLLFSSCGDFSLEHINRLSISTLKGAFRKRARETHPDRSMALETNTEILTEKFTEVSNAYSCLSEYLEKNRGTLSENILNQEKKKNRDRGAENFNYSSGHSFRGQRPFTSEDGCEKKFHIPKMKLLFGQYLYHAGHISFMNLIDAIIWQRGTRDSYGKIAKGWGILKHEDIILILKNQKPSEKFGECALRLCLITPIQQIDILNEQRKKQRLIGEFFIEKGILPLDKLQDIMIKFEIHNRRIKNRQKNQLK